MMVYESKHDMPGKRASPWCIAVALWSCVLACTIGSNMTLIDDGNDRGYMDAVTGILIMKSGPHSPITITNDTELEDFILAEGLQGNGTVGNPFVIRDFEINAGGTGKCLVLANITRYLTIVNCTFSNAGDNTVDGRNCSNINFTENRVIGNVQYNKYPVFFWRLYNSTIATNNITNQPNSRGLFLSTASNVTIEGNRIYNNDSGMQVSNCNNVRIYSNMVFDNDQHNIELYSSATNIEVAHNWLNNTSHYGIYVYQYASYCTIWNNSISHNEYENILITQYAHHITIRDNNLTDSYFGVRSDNCHYITIERNHATRNHHGFVLIAADYCRVVGNNASYNNYNGIVMEDLGGGASCNHNVVRLNTLVGNPTNNFQYSTAGINNSLYDLWYGNYYGNYLSQNPSATSDGVTWNLPYTTGGTVTAIDHHPLAVPYGSIPIVADVAKSTTGSIKAGQPITFYTMGYAGDPESTFQWNFGDGTSNATTRDATHVYQDAGTFTVRLTIVDYFNESVTLVRTGYVTVLPNLVPFANFTSPAAGIAGIPVAFTFTGTLGDVPNTFQWDFGDGTGNSTDQNPGHVFGSPGTYSVTLTVMDTDGDASTKFVQDHLTIAADLLPVANFTADGLVVLVNETVTFSFTGSRGNEPSSFQWDFGDLNGPASGENPAHAYASPGVFSVTLTVTDADGDSDSITKTAYITVEADEIPACNFIANATGGGIYHDFLFTYTGTPGNEPLSCAWDLGDGNVSSARDVLHRYGAVGTYTVSLTVTDTDGDVDTLVRTNYISVVDLVPVASFSVNATTLVENQHGRFTFTGTLGDGTNSISWDFGDGLLSSELHPVHGYGNPGTYTVSVTVADVDGDSDAEVRTGYITVVVDVLPSAVFTANATEVRSGGKVLFSFTGTLGNEPVQITWKLGGVPFATGTNVTKAFYIPGTYTVSVTIVDLDGDEDTMVLEGGITVLPATQGGDPDPLDQVIAFVTEYWYIVVPLIVVGIAVPIGAGIRKRRGRVRA